MREETADASRRAAMWAAFDRSRGRGKSVEDASRPVMPEAISSTSSSQGIMRLGRAGLEDTRGTGGGGEDNAEAVQHEAGQQ